MALTLLALCGPRFALSQPAPPAPAPRDTLLAPPPDSALAAPVRSVQDTVTVLPPVRVESERSLTPMRSSATTVRLDRAAVARFLPASTGDALLAVPGVELVKTGPWASRVSLRGLSGDRVLVMVDGVRVNSVRGHGGHPSMVPLDRLDGVELMPGASSAQFGSDALGGVINLVTHRSLFAPRAAASATLMARAAEPGSAREETARLQFASLGFGAELSGGLASLEALTTPAGRIANSGDHEQDWTARSAARLAGLELDFEHSRHAARDVGLPAFSSNAGSTASYPLQSRDADRLELTAPGANSRPDARLLAVLQGFRTDFTETSVDSAFVRGRFVATRATTAADRVRTRSWDLMPSLHLASLADLKLSAEARREWSQGPRLTEATVRSAAGVLTSDSLTAGESVPPAWRTVASGAAFAVPLTHPVRLETGLRYDVLRSHADSIAASPTSRLDVIDRRWSAEGGISRALAGVEPYIHLASGFRAPNLDERYFNDDIHGGLRLFGNPDLKPERSDSYEAGVRAAGLWPEHLTEARLSAFRSDVADLISFQYIGAVYLVPRFQYVNIQRARIEGLEATTRLRFGSAGLGLTFAAPRGVDRQNGKRLLDAGAARMTVDLSVPIPRVPLSSFDVRVRWNDAVKDVDSTFTRPAFWATALEASTQLYDTRVVLAVQNLLDLSYREPLSFIPEPGRTFALSLRREFGLPLFGASKEP